MSVNKVILIGNVGKDPEIRYFDNDSAVANFTLATTERGFKTSSGQEIPERTEWHNIVVWRGLAKVVESYVKKGTLIYIEGRLRTRSYDDKDGHKRYITEIYADNLTLLGRKSDNPSNTNTGTSPVTTKNTSQTSPIINESKPEGGNENLGAVSEDDDLPF